MINLAQKVLIASDHAGFSLKKIIISELNGLGIATFDLGCNSTEESVDYPDFAHELSKKLKNEFGILICGSGIGISIAANRHKNVRAALCHNIKCAKLARLHNNANVICLGARLVKEKPALAIVKAFLNTKFEGGRHERRVAKINP
ncbi:MAG: ribose 5-phosphate isomerase B [Proteobacteria bacterium]|nr:ribose 5-phosphate isomerase B [Pseudomonadota bacterium]